MPSPYLLAVEGAVLAGETLADDFGSLVHEHSWLVRLRGSKQGCSDNRERRKERGLSIGMRSCSHLCSSASLSAAGLMSMPQDSALVPYEQYDTGRALLNMIIPHHAVY